MHCCTGFFMFLFSQGLNIKTNIRRITLNLFLPLLFFSFFLFSFSTELGVISISNSVLDGVDNAYRDTYGLRMLTYGCAFTNLSMLFMRILHKGVYFRFATLARTFHFFIHLCVFALHLVMLRATVTPPVTVVIHALIATIPVLFDIGYNLYKGLYSVPVCM